LLPLYALVPQGSGDALPLKERQSKAKKSFFLYIPYTQTHLPVEASPAFDGKTGNGKWGDILAQLDSYVGELLDKVDQMGIRDNTIFIFTSDNGPEFTVPYQGFAGPWRGSYFTGYEGSLRVPFIMRWPGKIPAGLVSNEIVHETDIFPTLANRGGGEPTRTYEVPLFYNLLLDPGEKFPLQELEKNLWVRYPMSAALVKHLQSLQQEPPIRPGTPDPYLPKAK